MWVSFKDNIVYLWMLDHRKWATVTELKLLSSSQTVFHVLFLTSCHRQWSCGKVMFSFLCVCLFTIWVPREHYPWCIWSHCTGPPVIRLGTPYPSPPNTHRHQIWDLPGPGPLLVISGGHHLIPVPTSFKGPGVTFGGGYWTMYSWRKRAVRILSFLLDYFLAINVIVLVTEASPELVKQKTLRKSYSISLTPRRKTDRPSPM